MRFVFKKKVLSSIMAATMAAGFAASQNVAAIHLAEDGLGQVLLAPHYRASTSVQGFDTEGYSTEVVITNTRSDVAVKVKIVVRSETNSDELIDFMCYLTPTDVCRFELAEENGAVYLKSKDDSLKVEVPASDSTTPVVDSLSAAKATWASVYSQGLYKNLDEHIKTIRPGLASQLPKLTRRGHIEIQQVYAVQGVVPGYDKNGVLSQIKIEAGMSKYNLAKIFDTEGYSTEVVITNTRSDVASQEQQLKNSVVILTPHKPLCLRSQLPGHLLFAPLILIGFN